MPESLDKLVGLNPSLGTSVTMNSSRVRHWFNLTLNRAEPSSNSQRRYQRIVQSALTALAGKGVGILVSIISVPLTVGYLGAERYGVWITISTLLAWLNLADLGLGSGLTNALASAYGKERPDLAQRYVATAFGLLAAVAVIVGMIIAAVWQWIDWTELFKVQSALTRAEIPPAIAVAIALFLLNLPFSLITKIYNAYQEGAIANVWLALGNVASLVALIVVTRTQGGLVWLVGAYSGSLVLVASLSAIWLFGWHKRWLMPHWAFVHRNAVRELASTGGMFFVVQVAGLLIFQTDNLIIAHYLGASQVTPYSITYRLFSYALLLQSFVLPALWPAFGEALARKDVHWIKRTLRYNLTLSPIIAALSSLPFVLLGKAIILVWAGVEAVPPFTLLVWMGAWGIIYATMNAVGCFLNGVGHLQGQTIYGLATAIANIIITILLVKPYGINGVIAGTVLAYLICAVVPALVETKIVLNRLTA